MKTKLGSSILCLTLAAMVAMAQPAGTVIGTVLDPSQMAVPNVQAEIRSPKTGYSQTATSDQTGTFRFNNVPPSMYELVITKDGFATVKEPLEVQGAGPTSATYKLEMQAVATSIDVTGSSALIDTDPVAHTDTDASSFMKMPRFDPASGLSGIINNSTGGTAADANGFFHPLGDHAQVSFIIDGQPIGDQQSKAFSTQLPANAIQSMELITGAPEAQYGDKSSMVVNASTKSGLGVTKPSGTFEAGWGSFGTYSESATLAMGTAKFGNFLAVNALRTGHFLDTPEFLPIHDIGNNGNIFDRMDFQPNGRDLFHLNLFVARNWFQVPNDYDQLSQDQKQRVLTWNIAPSYQRTIGSSSLLTVNLFSRRDQVNYYASRNPLNDTPVTDSQNRFLTNYGGRVDFATSHKAHNVKAGFQMQQTKLIENFALAVTSPLLNSVCDAPGDIAVAATGITNPAQCSSANPTYFANPNFLAGLLPYDLTRGGNYFGFHGANDVNQFAFYVSDDIKLHQLTINLGLRDDQYNGLVNKNGVQPRVGLSYLVHRTDTVLRAAYSRTFETPFNENLLLSSAAGASGLAQSVFGARGIIPIEPGQRNQFNGGLQQRIGKYLVFDGDYFWKFTRNAYDFDMLFNTPITFPISWHNSKVDGFTGRLSTTKIHGFQASLTMGHSRARYFPPEVGGLLLQGTAATPGVFRIDHDQAYQQTATFRYQHKTDGPWGTLIWRYDSGLAVTGVADVAAALRLTPAQQVDIGLACNGTPATLTSPLQTCSGVGTSTLLSLPQSGTENNDHNPDRVQPRNLFDLAFGTDNITHADRNKISLRFTVTNLTNKIALYNFLSTFSGTHFVAPRTYQASIGYSF